jgi:dihydrofolate reductase
MRKIIVSEWMSLDGITDSASMDQWFNPYHSDSRAKSIQDTIHDCDAMLYGRNTYLMLYPYWSTLKNNEMGVADKLNKTKKYVVSTTLTTALWEDTTIIQKNVLKSITALKKQPGGNILVQGSTLLVKSLLATGLIDELKLLVQPYIMGADNSFFSGMKGALDLTESRQLDNGVMLLRYLPQNRS